jgi:hypothetical protein
VVKCVLEDAATKWRDERTNLTWLAQAPYINCTLPHKKRQPYPLSWEEQRLMFDELQPHSQCMSEFCTNTGARDEEICALQGLAPRREGDSGPEVPHRSPTARS